jgi:hypothetical protein
MTVAVDDVVGIMGVSRITIDSYPNTREPFPDG